MSQIKAGQSLKRGNGALQAPAHPLHYLEREDLPASASLASLQSLDGSTSSLAAVSSCKFLKKCLQAIINEL